MGEVADGEGGPVEAGAAQLAQDDVQHGPVADWQERFGQDGHVGPQAGGLSTGKDHGSLGHGGIIGHGADGLEIGERSRPAPSLWSDRQGGSVRFV